MPFLHSSKKSNKDTVQSPTAEGACRREMQLMTPACDLWDKAESWELRSPGSFHIDQSIDSSKLRVDSYLYSKPLGSIEARGLLQTEGRLGYQGRPHCSQEAVKHFQCCSENHTWNLFTSCVHSLSPQLDSVSTAQLCVFAAT